MNTPNKLTVVRMALIPVYVAIMYLPFDHAYLAANLVFIAAAITDALDGKIARKYNLVTDFGKLMDPLADKLLVMAAMVVLVDIGFAPAWVVIVILAREFLVSLIRQIAATRGKVIAADNLGKLKTIFQMVWLISGMFYLWADFNLPVFGWCWLFVACQVLGYLTAALTLLSGGNYVLKNKELLSWENQS